MEKLYVVVRGDLPPGLQVAQSIHAARQFAAEHPELELAWFQRSNTIAVLSASSEAHLNELLRAARYKGLRTSSFHEPDLEGSLTAITLEPGTTSRNLLRRLPLALSSSQKPSPMTLVLVPELSPM